MMISTLFFRSRFCASILSMLMCSNPIYAETLTSPTFQVKAAIVNGCLLGSSETDTSSFGSIVFSPVTTLSSHIDVVSTQNAGSIIVKCTPGTTVTLAIDRGLNASSSISSGRLMRLQSGTATLLYQIFQDSSFTTIWGDGANGGVTKVVSATGGSDEYKIYARLYAVSSAPAPGIYSDTVTITVTY